MIKKSLLFIVLPGSLMLLIVFGGTVASIISFILLILLAIYAYTERDKIFVPNIKSSGYVPPSSNTFSEESSGDSGEGFTIVQTITKDSPVLPHKAEEHLNEEKIPDTSENPVVPIPITSNGVKYSNSSEYQHPKVTIHSKTNETDTDEINRKFREIVNSTIPNYESKREEINHVFELFLEVIREAQSAYTAIYFGYIKSSDKLFVKLSSGNKEQLIDSHFEIEDDFLSNVVKNGKANFIAELLPAAEPDNIKYYSESQKIRSVAAVPVQYSNSLIGVLLIDSKENDAFGEESIYTLGKYVRLITLYLGLFESKFNNANAEQKLELVNKLYENLFKIETLEDIQTLVYDNLAKLISCDRCVLIQTDPNTNKSIAAVVFNNSGKRYLQEGESLEEGLSIVYQSISGKSPRIINDLSDSKFIRFKENENIELTGSFMTIPLVYKDFCYGAVCYESKRTGAFTAQESMFLFNALGALAFYLYSHNMQATLKRFITRDVETNVFTKEYFLERLQGELQKTQILKLPGSFILLELDALIYDPNLFETNPVKKASNALAKILINEVEPMSLLGRINDKTFAIYRFNVQQEEAFVWAERLRGKVSGEPISLYSKKTTITISGVVLPVTEKSTVENLIEKAQLSLSKTVSDRSNRIIKTT